ncbi:hypothetical protein [Streptomyces erythrochromogenes]|uniref:hypothetical protein n=1 Tax=Streptomyces erythrochromogenes TaxID=285574 RepID=UPI0036D12470
MSAGSDNGTGSGEESFDAASAEHSIARLKVAYESVVTLPRVPGSLTLEAVLEPAEAAPYFIGVRELMSW